MQLFNGYFAIDVGPPAHNDLWSICSVWIVQRNILTRVIFSFLPVNIPSSGESSSGVEVVGCVNI